MRGVWIVLGTTAAFLATLVVFVTLEQPLHIPVKVTTIALAVMTVGTGVFIATRERLPFAPTRTEALALRQQRKSDLAAFRVFGEPMDRPTFFAEIYNRGAKPFNATVFWEDRTDRVMEGRILVEGNSLLTQRGMFESLWESARLERANRGHPLTDRLNDVIWPEVHDAGILIETVDNDDGSRSAILAVGATHSLSKQEWVKAHGLGFGRYRSAWLEEPLIRAEVVTPSGRRMRMDSTAMPLFHLKLTELVLEGEAQTDPLARKDGGVSYDYPEEWR